MGGMTRPGTATVPKNALYRPVSGDDWRDWREIKEEELALLEEAERRIFERQCKKPCKRYFEGEWHQGPRTCLDFRAAGGKVACAAYSYDKAAADRARFFAQWDGAKDRAAGWCRAPGVELSPEDLGGLACAAMAVNATTPDEALAYLRLLKGDAMAARIASAFDDDDARA